MQNETVSTTYMDDKLIEIINKPPIPDRYPSLYRYMLQSVVSQCRPYAVQYLKAMMIPEYDWKGYFTIIETVASSRLSGYDASLGSAADHLCPYIMKEFFEVRDEGPRCNSIVRKLRAVAANQLKEEGIPHPDSTAIADRINKRMKMYRSIPP